MRSFLSFYLVVPIVLMGCNESGENTACPVQVRQQVVLSEKARSCGRNLSLENLTPSCNTIESADDFEPACNPHLAQNAWSASHRNNFAQASSPLPGVVGDRPFEVKHQTTLSIPIVLNFSEPDSQNRQALWASTISRAGQVCKCEILRHSHILPCEQIRQKTAGSLGAGT